MAAMSDGDRLRMAADRLDSRVFGIRRMAREVQWMPTEGCGEYAATAALLRAVAAHHVSDSDGELCYVDRQVWPCPQMRAAVALADAILGDEK